MATAILGAAAGIVTAESIIELNRSIFLPMIYQGIIYTASDKAEATRETQYFQDHYAAPVFDYIDSFQRQGISLLEEFLNVDIDRNGDIGNVNDQPDEPAVALADFNAGPNPPKPTKSTDELINEYLSKTAGKPKPAQVMVSDAQENNQIPEEIQAQVSATTATTPMGITTAGPSVNSKLARAFSKPEPQTNRPMF